MKVNKFITQKYLSAKADKGIDGVITIIDSVFEENINGQDKLVMRLKGQEKPMVLNQTNLNALMMAYGEDTDLWVSRKVQLIIVTVMFNGVPTEGIQVKPIK